LKVENLRLWLKAVRAPFFTATVTSGILGSVCAWRDTGSFNRFYFFLTVLGIIAVNAGTNLINDYFDHTSGLDEINGNYNRFSGGSRVIQNKQISPGKMLTAGITAFCTAAATGLYLNFKTAGNVIFFIGITGIFLGYFYTAEPLRIGYTPLGEMVTGLCCGPLIILGSYYVQAQALSFSVFWISVPVGILVALILLINEFPDYYADRAANKKTLVVLLGRKKAFGVYRFFFFLSYLMVIAGVLLGLIPVFTLSVLITLPLALKTVRMAGKNCNEIIKLLPANEMTIKIHLFFGFLLIISYTAGRLLYGI